MGNRIFCVENGGDHSEERESREWQGRAVRTLSTMIQNCKSVLTQWERVQLLLLQLQLPASWSPLLAEQGQVKGGIPCWPVWGESDCRWPDNLAPKTYWWCGLLVMQVCIQRSPISKARISPEGTTNHLNTLAGGVRKRPPDSSFPLGKDLWILFLQLS
jgi:hypothetical protein